MNRELFLSSLADNGCFALEYYLHKHEIDNNLLRDGIEYCELITDASYKSNIKKFIKDEEKFRRIETIQKYYTCGKLIEYSKTASEIRKYLIDMLNKKDVKLSEEKIRSYQHFFNETSGIFLAAEIKNMRLKSELKRRIWKGL